MTEINFELHGVHAHELRDRVIIDALNEYIDHMDNNHFDVQDGTTLTLRDADGKYQANYTVRVIGSSRHVEFTEFSNSH